MVSRAHDWIAEYDGIEDITCFLGFCFELRGIMLDDTLLRYRLASYLLSVLWGEL
jgi:hypothetical protein